MDLRTPQRPDCPRKFFSSVRADSPSRQSARSKSSAVLPSSCCAFCDSSRSPARFTSRSLRPPSKAKTATSISVITRSEEHTSELQSRGHLVCRLLLEKKKKQI